MRTGFRIVSLNSRERNGKRGNVLKFARYKCIRDKDSGGRDTPLRKEDTSEIRTAGGKKAGKKITADGRIT